MTPDAQQWLAIALESAAAGDWEECVLAGVPALLLDAGCGGGELARVLRRAAAILLPKGWVAATNDAGWVDATLAAGACSRVLVLSRGGLGLRSVIASPPPRSLVLHPALSSLEPLFASMLRGDRTRLEWLAAHDERAPAEERGAPQEGASLLLWAVPPAGPSEALLREVQVRAMAAGSHVAPRTVEIWALPVQSYEDAGRRSRRALERLLLCCNDDDDDDDDDFADARAAMRDAARPHPLRLDEWRYKALAPPTRVWRWHAPAEPPLPCTGSASCSAGGVRETVASADGLLDAFVLWTEVEVADGVWRSNAPPAATAAALGSRSCRSATPGVLEPQVACCVQRPRRVRRGQPLRLSCRLGSDEGSGPRCALEPDSPPPPAEVAIETPAAAPARPAAAALPAWCAWMMNDVERAEGYAAALDATMRRRREWQPPSSAAAASAAASSQPPTPPPAIILDVGCGAGLLSLLAAKAAAAHGVAAVVIGVERDAALVGLAAAAFAAARRAGKLPPSVSLHVIHSDALELSIDGDVAGAGAGAGAGEGAEASPAAALPLHLSSLPRRADLLVTEIFGDDALAEAALPLLRHATAHLLRPGGATVPAQLSLRAALARLPPQLHSDVQAACRLDLPPPPPEPPPPYELMHALEPRRLAVDLRDCVGLALGAEVELWRAPLRPPPDLRGALAVHGTLAVPPLVGGGAEANAVVSWFELQLCGDGGGDGGGVCIGSSPCSSLTHWRQLVVPLTDAQARAVASGGRGGDAGGATLRYVVHDDEYELWVE